MENKIGASIKKTFAQLVADRQPLEKIWKDAYQYTSPLRGQYFVSQNTDGIRGAVSATLINLVFSILLLVMLLACLLLV